MLKRYFIGLILTILLPLVVQAVDTNIPTDRSDGASTDQAIETSTDQTTDTSTGPTIGASPDQSADISTNQPSGTTTDHPLDTKTDQSVAPQADNPNTEPPVVKLLPQVRRQPLIEDRLLVIPLQDIQPFLSRPRVMSAEALKAAPVILAFAEEHAAGGPGDRMYVNGLDAASNGQDLTHQRFEVVRQGQSYKDPDSHEFLGYEMLYVGEAEVVKDGEPAELLLTTAKMEAQVDDMVFPAAAQPMEGNFTPIPAPSNIEGVILAVLGGVSQIGVYNVVAITKGTEDGLKIGHMLQILQRVRLPLSIKATKKIIDLPLEQIGTLMVFRTFEHISYAIIMQAKGAIHVGDSIHGSGT